MRSYSLTGTTLPNPIPIDNSRMFGTTSREEIYGRRPSQTAQSPPAPLLAFRDFSKEAAERAKGSSPVAGTSLGAGASALANANADAPLAPTHDKTDRVAHMAGSRAELYGRRPSLVGPDGRVPPAGKPEWVKGSSAAQESAVFEDDDEDKQGK
ncbi:hypothetical protein CspeluHIS016_0803250 [Cutaneotrichosporon spelunceum]|uniref:Uncharacterized protein n=1 Tax=Cutaneotrichosporon spelunceum TaxID=1672016 RepID=A0AAD3U023_9TREE|nr:hypothetical protein CspeluHIS016_0803250 [Cutaneotrichosporon spelunceum]